MNGLPYIYLPRPDECVKVDRHGSGTRDVQVSVCGQGAGSVRILADEVPGAAAGIAAAMHEAAGLPAPVILERPTGTPPRFSGIKTGRNGDSVLLWIGGNRDALNAGAARDLAARIAVLADEAEEDEPDPAEVGELAEIIVTTDPRSRGYSPDPEVIARAALRWMKDKQQRGGERHG